MKRTRALAGAAALCLTGGYLLLASGTAAGPLSCTVAPLLLVAGYCGLVPAAILTRRSAA